MKKIIWVAAVVLCIAIGVAGGYWFGMRGTSSEKPVTQATNEQKKSTLESSPTPSVSPTPSANAVTYGTCGSSPEAKTFYDKVIGLQFCYPKEWGEATVGTVPASASDAGGAYEITFSAKSGLTVASATVDWKNTIGRDGRCADPMSAPIDFSGYAESWKTEGEGMALTSASRYVNKVDGRWWISELASDYYSAVCLKAAVSTLGGVYDLQTVNYQVAFNDQIASVKAHVDNPTVLISPAERVQFGEMVDSMQHVK